MENLQIRTINSKSKKAIYVNNIAHAINFLRHDEDKIIIKSSEQVEIEIIDNGKSIFFGSKLELFNLIKTSLTK